MPRTSSPFPPALRPTSAPSTRAPHRGRATRPFFPGPRLVHHDGLVLDSGLHHQVWCPFRRAYVTLSRKDHSFLLESTHPIPGLALLGNAPAGGA